MGRKSYDDTYRHALASSNPFAYIEKTWGDPKPYFTRFLFPYISQKHVVVEIGAGFGRYTSLVVPLCQKVYAVEVSEMCLKFLNERNVAFPLPVNVTPVRASELDKIEHGIGFAFSMSTMLHFSLGEIYWYMKELAPRFFSGAKFVIHYMDLESGLEMFRKRHGTFDVGTYCFHSPESLRLIGQAAGLALDSIEIPEEPIIAGHGFAVFCRE